MCINIDIYIYIYVHMVPPENPMPQVILGQFRFVLVLLLLTFLTVDGGVVMAEGWRWNSERFRRFAASVCLWSVDMLAERCPKQSHKQVIGPKTSGFQDVQKSRFPE